MASEWPVLRAEQVCDLIVDCVNKTAPTVGERTAYRMIRTTNVRNGRIDLSDCKYVSQETYEKWTRRAQLQSGDVVLTREAPIGEVGFVRESEGVFLGQRLMQYRANKAMLEPRFLLFSFLSPALQHQFGSHEGSGSVVSHIRVADCFKFELAVPPLNEQRVIAETLGALDDRIDNLRQTNATLEAIAQALFKSWFVDFDGVSPEDMQESELGLIPKGWRVGCVGDVADIKGGRQLEKQHFIEQGAHPVFGGAGEMGRTDLWNADGFVITVGRVGAYCGQFFWHLGSAWVNNNASRIVVSDDAGYWLYWALRNADIGKIKKGAAQPFVSNGDLAAMRIVIPDHVVLNEFNSLVQALHQRMSLLVQQAATLAALQDMSLPRLISGQIRICEVERIAEVSTA